MSAFIAGIADFDDGPGIVLNVGVKMIHVVGAEIVSINLLDQLARCVRSSCPPTIVIREAAPFIYSYSKVKKQHEENSCFTYRLSALRR